MSRDLLHARDRLARSEAGSGRAENGGGRVQVVAGYQSLDPIVRRAWRMLPSGTICPCAFLV